MSYASFNGISGLVRAFLRSSSSWNSSTNSDGEDITGATDETGNADATLANSPSVPEYNDTPTGGFEGPTILHVSGENGLAIGGIDLSADTSWSIGIALRSDAFGTFRNLFSSQGGAEEGSLYADASGNLSYQEASTEGIGTTLSTGTVYRVIFTSDASNYRLYIDGTLVWTSTMTPSTGPTALETAAYGGTGAGWAGDWWALVVYNTTVSGADIATLDAALLEEVEGVPAGSIAGDATITFTAAGEATATGALAGSASISITAAGGLDLDGMRGDATISVSATGELTGIGELAGTASISFTATATEDSTVETTTGLTDYFNGTGGLDGYTTLNAASLSDVTETGGYYRASVVGTTVNDTLHFNGSYGRYDYKLISFPFEVWFLGCRLAIPSDPDTEPSVTNEYLFTGAQANNDPSNPTDAYQHMVVGHRGAPGGGQGGRTVEIKTTTSASSSQTDVGEDALTVMRADIRVVGNAGSPNTIDWYWRAEGDTAWNGPVTMPGTEPSWNNTIALGLVTYAFEHYGPDFAGYVDAIVDMSNNLYADASVSFSATGTLTGYNLSGSATVTIDASATIVATGELSGAASFSVTAAGGLASDAIEGSASIAIDAAGDLTGSGELDGSSSLALTASATAFGTGELASDDSFSITASATLTGAAEASGSASFTITTTGSIVDGNNALAGSSNITFTASGTLTAPGELSGNLSFSITAVGNISAVGPLAGSGSFSIATTGTITSSTVATGGGGSSNLLASFTVATGGTASTLYTDSTKIDGYYDRMMAIVTDGDEHGARRIVRSLLADGALIMESPLPFTPSAGATVQIIAVPQDYPAVVGSGSRS